MLRHHYLFGKEPWKLIINTRDPKKSGPSLKLAKSRLAKQRTEASLGLPSPSLPS